MEPPTKATVGVYTVWSIIALTITEGLDSTGLPLPTSSVTSRFHYFHQPTRYQATSILQTELARNIATGHFTDRATIGKSTIPPGKQALANNLRLGKIAPTTNAIVIQAHNTPLPVHWQCPFNSSTSAVEAVTPPPRRICTTRSERPVFTASD